ncbi:Fcf1-domain-containing protein [Biscogniauxia mediterranea]|nr:Fcf1-domain-containing protein [Biscogniauxia mediterranea]
MPRAKTSKKYKKLMSQYVMGWNFREPYQILLDADFVITATDCKMEMERLLADIVHGQVKLMITQCSMRHLYAHKSASAIELAKTFERRRCGHHPDQYPEPLSTLECLMSVVDPKDQGVNKFKYCGAINDEDVRAALRRIPGVPLVYIRRSVMIMEPMAAATAKVRSREERLKFRAELKTIGGGKRKRDEDETDDEDGKEPTRQVGETNKPEKKKKKGPKGPNPLSVKKKKPNSTSGTKLQSDKPKTEEGGPDDAAAAGDAGSEEAPKKKRRRKHKSKNTDATSAPEQASNDVEGGEGRRET